MAVVGIGLTAVVAPWPALPGGPVVLPWWALAPLFHVVELRVIHLQTQRETQSFTLIELPLVAGLFLATPADLVLAAVVGAGTGLAIHRRPVPVKLAFNLALFLLSTAFAALLFHGLIGAATPVDPRAWGVTFASTLAATGVGLVAVTAAIVLAQGRTDTARLAAAARFGFAVAATNTALGLIGVTLLWMAPGSAWLLAIPIMLVAIAWRAYRAEVGEREARERLELLYEGTRILHGGGDLEHAIEALLLEARRTFRGEVAELILSVADDHDAGLRTIVGPGDAVSTMASVRLDPIADAMHLRAVRRGASFAIAPLAAGVSHPDRIGSTPVRDALVAPLTGERGVIGSIIIANRLGTLGTFRPDEMRLFETLANHAGVALENGRLGRSLSDLRAVKEQLRHQALHDSLTGLGNRDLLLERLEAALARRSHAGPVPVVLFIDLDDFKSVNDTLGHAIGDALLRSVASAIRGAIRPTDLAVRLAGDEFGVLIEDGRDLGAIIRVAERILESVRRPVELEGHWMAASASIGIAATHGLRQSADDLLREADLAMYAAKGRGKGRFALFDPELRTEITERQRLRDELAVAVARRQLSLRYQPVTDLASGAIVGFEALLRWNHPERGEMAPGAFLGVADESGLIVPVGRWVLREACRTARGWEDGPGTAPSIHVNLSVRQLLAPDLVDDVAGVLRATGLDPARLTLELDEAQVMTDDPAIPARLVQLKALGVRLAIDGFGLGFLSVRDLGRYPVDVIKIARPVVNAMGRTREDARIAEAIVALGRSLHLEVVAEGIESSAQLDRVRGLRVDGAQGFHLGAPIAASGVLSLLAGRVPDRAGPAKGAPVAVA
jgi:diguanylate cyclase (GGDEF)-like protein